MRKTIVLILAATLLSCFAALMPTRALAQEPQMTVTVDTVSGYPGKEADIAINVTVPEDVASMAFNVAYDEILTLESVEFDPDLGGVTTTSPSLASPAMISWVNGTVEKTGRLLFAVLHFTVSESARNGDAAAVRLTYDPDNIYDGNEENIDCLVISGGVNVSVGMPGDVNGDEKVNNKDVTRLMRYIARWDVETVNAALDVNGDCKINNKDVSRLMQFIAGWEVDMYYAGVLVVCNHLTEAHPAAAATCTESGNIAYWTCTKCGKLFADADASKEISGKDTVIPAGHTVATEAGTAPTCTEPGQTDKQYCSVCGVVLQEHETIPAAGHTYKTLPAVEPTCTEPGLTAGTGCENCDAIIVAQNEVPALGHDFVNNVCSRCGEPEFEKSTLYLYKNGEYIGTKDVYKTQSFSLDCDAGYDTVWYLNGKAVTDKSGASLTVWNMDPDGYDVFSTPVPTTFTITYNFNGGNASGTYPVTYDIESDSITLDAPDRIGYTFTGWSGTDIDGLEKNVTISSGSIGNRTYTANWQINTYTITYVLHGGTIADGVNPVNYTYEDDFYLQKPSQECCTFLGWYSEGKKISHIYQGSSDLTLVAKWEFALTLSGNTVTGLTDYGKTITTLKIPRNFDGTDITAIASGAFKECSNLIHVVLRDSITSIGQYAFQDCKKLVSINIPSSVKSIGTRAVSGCNSLTVIYSGPVSDWCKISFGSQWLTGEADLVFNGSSSTKVITLKIPETVNNIPAYAFSYFRSIESVTIPSSVKSIGKGAFENCTNLASMNISFAPSYFGSIFGASSASDNASYVPTSLKTVVITGGEIICDSAFSGCNSITSLTLPDTLRSIGLRAFNDCTGITGITIPSNVTSIGKGAFQNCTSLEIMYTPFAMTFFGYIFGASNYNDNQTFVPTSLKYVTITSGAISDRAFYKCKNIKILELRNKVTKIGSLAFFGCTGLTGFNVPDSVTEIGEGAFRNCYLSTLSVPFIGKSNSATGYEAVFGYIFGYECFSSYVDSQNSSSNVFINKRVGDDSDNPRWQYSCYNSYDSTYSCYRLTSYYYYIPTFYLEKVIVTGTKVSDYAFFNCWNNIREVILMDTVTRIGTNAFEGCSAIITKTDF